FFLSPKYPAKRPLGLLISISTQILPSSFAGNATPSSSAITTGYIKVGNPIDPNFIGILGKLAIIQVLSVCPNPSLMVISVAFSHISIISGFNGSPAATHDLNEN